EAGMRQCPSSASQLLWRSAHPLDEKQVCRCPPGRARTALSSGGCVAGFADTPGGPSCPARSDGAKRSFFSANAVRIFALWFQMRVSSMMGSFRDSQALTGVPGPELALRTVLLVKDSLAASGIARPFKEAHRVRVGE